MAIANMQVQFDNLFWLFTYLAIAVSIIVFGLMVVFIIKYREKPGSGEPHDAPILGRLPVPRGHARTAIMTVSLSTILLGVLIIGSFGSIDTILSTPAPCNIPIYNYTSYNCSVLVSGWRYFWEFTYPNYTNRPQDGVLVVPVHENIRLNVTSGGNSGNPAVYHAFGIIAFKVKADAYPGHVNNIWFNADTVGNYTIQCYEFCGVGHPTMIGTLEVVPLPQFVSWYNSTIVH
jgi:cytochrome c oxidase subunit II